MHFLHDCYIRTLIGSFPITKQPYIIWHIAILRAAPVYVGRKKNTHTLMHTVALTLILKICKLKVHVCKSSHVHVRS